MCSVPFTIYFTTQKLATGSAGSVPPPYSGVFHMPTIMHYMEILKINTTGSVWSVVMVSLASPLLPVVLT